MRIVSISPALLPAALTLFACSSGGDDTTVAAMVPLTAGVARPERVRDAKGHILNWRRHVVSSQGAQSTTPEPDQVGEADDPEALSNDELAEALRPVALVGSEEYEGEASPELVRAVRERGRSRSTPPYKPDVLVERNPSGMNKSLGVIGNDDRQGITDNKTYPMSTVVDVHTLESWATNDTTCSGTVVGASTIVTSAHCVHDGASWKPLPIFSPGTDWHDGSYDKPNGSYPFGKHSCYSVVIPTAFITGTPGSGAAAYDYAVVEFSYCGDYLGNSTGWKGLWVYGDADMNLAAGYLYGHPCDKLQPQIWGSSVPSNGFTADGVFIRTNLDVAECMSGSGMYTMNSGAPYLLGIFKAAVPGSDGSAPYNFGVRVNNAVFQFILDNSAL